MFGVSLVSLIAQLRNGSSRFILCDASPPNSPQRDYLEKLIQLLPNSVTLAKPGDVPTILCSLVDEMKQRSESEESANSSTTFLMIHGMHRFNKLRYEEDF